MARILVVEDDDECRSAVRELLETHGFEVSEAPNGEAALEHMLSADEPSLVILDLEMPIMSGTELLKIMTNHNRLSRVPVLVLSGSAKAPATQHAAVVGVFAKPFDVAVFVETVRAQVGKPAGGSSPV